MYPFNVASSIAATVLRTGMGIGAQPAAKQPAQLLKLYEFEGCPHCRLVREVLTELDLDALILPCPKGGSRYRDTVISQGGKAQFPYLDDPNTGTQMYESADIVAYLYATYAQRDVPWYWRMIEVQRLGSVLASIPRVWLGMQVRASKTPEEPLILYSFESSPFARLVRDLLCEMELPYILKSVGRTQVEDWVPPLMRRQRDSHAIPASRNRAELAQRAGVVSVPYLVDPNTQTEMAESADILAYLEATYGS